MRLDTAAKRAAHRAAFIPNCATIDPRSSEAGEVYTYERAGGIYAIGFRRTAGRPSFHYRFKDAAGREAHIVGFFTSINEHKERIAKQRAEASAYQHDVKVGDIFRASWGYDQTNIDYYQVVALRGKCMAEFREIQQQSEETGWLQGKCVPAPGKWATEADYSETGKAHKEKHGYYPTKAKESFRAKIQGSGNSGPCFRVASYCCAYRIQPVAKIAGAPIFEESHWTAYA